jgi:signal transduction histidine kinase
MLSVRQRIAFWFVGLSTLVYITPTLLGVFFFYYTLTSALDHELKTLASSLGHAIDLQGGMPHFRDWARVVQTDPARAICTIQLFDQHGRMLEHYGAEGIERLIQNANEATEGGRSMRIRVSPLVVDGRSLGFLQIQIPTRERDAATRQFAVTMAIIAPVVLIGLGLCGLLVSDKAMVPIEDTIKMLRQFMADAGHELSTPLSIIDASAESLQHKLGKQSIVMKETAVISNSAERMQKIIDDLMLLAELQTPVKQSIIRKSVAVDDLVGDCVNNFLVKFEQKQVTLERSPAPAPVPPLVVSGDRDELVNMLSNLLENALRYTEPGGTVTVSTAANADCSLILTVADTGIGIAEECLPFVFDRFYRVDKSRSRASGGSGLGLPIVKAVAEAHDGRIEVVSKIGQGTKFTIRLPLQP